MSARLINRGERLTVIEKLLFRSGKGLRAVEIAEACDVDRRTVYRDLETLQKLGIPISQEDGRFYLNRDYYLASVRMNFNEAVALFLAARAFTRNAEQQNPHIVSALNKLCAALPEPLSSHVDYIADWIRGNPVDRNYVQVLEMIIRGWVEGRTIRLWGSSSKNGESYVRDFRTYFIEPTTTGGLYTVGQDALSQSIKVLKIEWIKRAKLLDEEYEMPEQFDRRPYLETVWGVMDGDGRDRMKVVLAFAQDVTSLIRERLWHSSQQVEILPDKRCTLTVQVTDWHDLMPWLRSWGTQVEVLEPNGLRQQLAVEALQMAHMYASAVR